MKSEIKERWIKALESGDYKHGRLYLWDSNNRYCAMGVLCDLYHKTVEPIWDSEKKGITHTVYGLTSAAPESVLEWLGADDYSKVCTKITITNDCNNDYTEVIKVIKEQL